MRERKPGDLLPLTGRWLRYFVGGLLLIGGAAVLALSFSHHLRLGSSTFELLCWTGAASINAGFLTLTYPHENPRR